MDFSTPKPVTARYDFSHDLRKSREVQSMAWDLWVRDEGYSNSDVNINRRNLKGDIGTLVIAAARTEISIS
jgi:hypothetical protein